MNVLKENVCGKQMNADYGTVLLNTNIFFIHAFAELRECILILSPVVLLGFVEDLGQPEERNGHG